MENNKNDLILQMEDPYTEQSNNNNRVVLKELLSSNITEQETNCKPEMETLYEKSKTNISENLLTELSFEDETLTATKLRNSLSRLSSLTEDETISYNNNNKTTNTADRQQTIADKNLLSNVEKSNNLTLAAENHMNVSFTCEPMDVDEDIEDYLNYENATALMEKVENVNDKPHQAENKSISVMANDSKMLEKITEFPPEESKDLNFNSTFDSNELNESANKAQTQLTAFPITNQIVNCDGFPKSPNKTDTVKITAETHETKNEESRTLPNFEIISQQKNYPVSSDECESEKSFDKSQNKIEHNFSNIITNEKKNSFSFEKECQKLDDSTTIGTEENICLNFNSTFGSNDLPKVESNSLNESKNEQIAQSTAFPITHQILNSKQFPKSPNKNDIIEIISEYYEINNTPTSENFALMPEENAESIYKRSLAMSSLDEENKSNNVTQIDDNLINFIATDQKVVTVEKGGNEGNLDSLEQNKELNFNSTFSSNEFPSQDITPSLGFPIKNYEKLHLTKSPKSANTDLNLETTATFETKKDNSGTSEQIPSNESISEKSLNKTSEDKSYIDDDRKKVPQLPHIFFDTRFADESTAKSLSEKPVENTDQPKKNICTKSPNVSPSISPKNVSPLSNENKPTSDANDKDINQRNNNNENRNGIFAQSHTKEQMFEKFDDRDSEATEFYDNFVVEPFDFDYLLTKGNSCVQLDRNSLLLRFDPLLGAPVPVNSKQHNRLESVLNAQQCTEIPQEEELHEIEEKKLNTSTPTKTENTQSNSPFEDIENMSVDVVFELATNAALSSTIANKEDNNNMNDMENKIKTEVLKTEDLERKLKDAEQREEALIKRITEKEKMLNKVNGVVEAYEKAIAELVAEKGEIVQNYEKQLADVKADRDSNYRHLTSLETTFSDLHVKYEKSKEMTQQLQASTDMLVEEKKRALEDLRLQEQRYLKMKSHAMQQLEIANKQLASLTKEHGIEITKLKALLKKEEISRASINEQLHQKSRENAELMKICDELINGQGS